MNSTPQSSRLYRLQEKLTQSRYWTFSLAIHAVLLAVISTWVLVENAPDEDADFSGVVDVADPGPILDFQRPLEQPVVDIKQPAVVPEPRLPAQDRPEM